MRESRADAVRTGVLAVSRLASSRMLWALQHIHIQAGPALITASDPSNRIQPSVDGEQTVMTALQACSWQLVINLLSTKG